MLVLEKNISTCNSCGNIKPRNTVGKFDARNKKFADDAGRLWNGRMCPECHAERTKKKMQQLRDKRKATP